METKSIKQTVEPGDIFRSSWGYDQTNINFYHIVSVKGQFATLIKLKNEVVRGTGWASELVIPSDQTVGAPFRKKINKSDHFGFFFKIENYAYAYPWKGNAEHQTHYH